MRMDSNDRMAPPEDANPEDDTSQADTASTTLVGANILGINAGTFPGGIAGPAAEIAAGESADETDPALRQSDLTGMDSPNRVTGDQGVSAKQREVEADELNS
jgi:hypothetical protein